MFAFRNTVTLGLLCAALCFACGDKQNPNGDFKTDSSASDSTSAAVSYSLTIAPMMAASCAISGCHSGSGPASGIPLDTYANVSANASLADSAIKAKRMPIGSGAALTATDIQNFQDWVAAGTPDN